MRYSYDTASSAPIFANGASTAAFSKLFEGASQYYRRETGYPADWRPGENRTNPFYEPDANGRLEIGDQRMNVFGNNAPGSLCSQGTSCSKFFNALPLFNATAGGHDRIFNKPSGIKFTPFSNVATMLPAAAITFSAVVGNSFQGCRAILCRGISFRRMMSGSAKNVTGSREATFDVDCVGSSASAVVIDVLLGGCPARKFQRLS